MFTADRGAFAFLMHNNARRGARNCLSRRSLGRVSLRLARERANRTTYSVLGRTQQDFPKLPKGLASVRELKRAPDGRQADSRTTRSAVSPSGATDGHPRWSEGSSKSLQSRSMSARVGGLGSLTESTEDTEGGGRFGVLDVDLRCPSGARQSPGGEADGDCGTLDVSLRWEWSTRIIDVVPIPRRQADSSSNPLRSLPFGGD